MSCTDEINSIIDCYGHQPTRALLGQLRYFCKKVSNKFTINVLPKGPTKKIVIKIPEAKIDIARYIDNESYNNPDLVSEFLGRST